MIDYDYPLYRPPAEADNLIIQATYGCSHNNCSFCTMYKSKKYEVRDINELYKEIDTLAALYPHTRKIFLADGDALALDTDYLVTLLQYLQKTFSKLTRVSLYATAQNLLAKSEGALELLQSHKLTLVYFGIETGSDKLLKKIAKGVNAQELIQAVDKASKAKIKVSATVILGLGGETYSKEHIEETAELINATKINYLSTLHLWLEDEVKERFLKPFDGRFIMLDDYQFLEEQKRFLELLSPSNNVIFRSNHVSNVLALAGTLPKDRDRLLEEVAFAIKR